MPRSTLKNSVDGASWTVPVPKSINRLLYLSDGGDAANVYDYANCKQVGKLTSLDDLGARRQLS